MKAFISGMLVFALVLCTIPGTSTAIEQQKSVKDIVSSMTLDEKIGQMLMPDFRNWKKTGESSTSGLTEMNDEVAGLVEKYHLGGVILFAENVVDTEQTVRLTDGFQQASPDIPLLMTIDQEGGIVTRLQSGTNLPGNMALGAARSMKNAYASGKIIGSELHSLGLNVNFSPVLDVNNNPDNPVIGVRSFSSNPGLVADLGIATMKGLQEENMAVTAKHFPGHGDTAVDSHYGLPLVSHGEERLREVELYPFEQAINAGVDVIMTAHVQFPAFDETTYISKKDGQEIMVPATLSKKVLTGLLREDLGFDGVIVTDALNMKAIADNFGQEEAVVMALQAGVDIALMPASVTSLEEEYRLANVIDAVKDAVSSGELPIEQINQSVERILTLKMERGIFTPEPVSLAEKINQALETVGNKTHQKLEEKMAEEAVTVLKNEGKTLPFKPKKHDRILILAPFTDQIEAMKRSIRQIKKLKDVSIDTYSFSGQVMNDDVKAKIDQADYVITGSYVVQNDPVVEDGVIDDGIKDPSKWATVFPRAAMNYAKEKKKKFVLMSLRNPYDAANFEEADALIAVYGFKGYTNGRFRQPNIPAGINVIFGKATPKGKLPVDIPSVTNPGDILFDYGYGLWLTS